MVKRRKGSESVRISSLWLIVFFIGALALVFKLVSDKIMTQVNIVHNALKVESLDVSSPQFSVEMKAIIVRAKAIWDVPTYLLAHSQRTVEILHIFRGYKYEGLVTYTDVLGKPRSFQLTRDGKDALLKFDTLVYQVSPNNLEIAPGNAVFKDGILKNIQSPELKIRTHGKVFQAKNMNVDVGIDPHELTMNFESLIFDRLRIENLTLNVRTNLLIPGVKKAEVTYLEGKGIYKGAPFDFMWNESRDDDEQLKLMGVGTIPIIAFHAIIRPIKQRMLKVEREKVVATADKMKILQFDLLKKLNLGRYEKQFITRFIPDGYYRKDKSFFHFDIRPEAIMSEKKIQKSAKTYFKMSKLKPEKAVLYLRNSCGLGYGEACYRLGTLSSSAQFFELGCTLKHSESCKKLKRLITNK